MYAQRLLLKYTTLIIAFLCVLPILYILPSIFKEPSEVYQHIQAYLLVDYALDTLLVSLYTLLFSLLFGLFPAYFISRFHFPGRKFFSITLLFPLALPAYISAYTYLELLSWSGSLKKALDALYLPVPDIHTPFWAGILMASALFPYIFTFCKFTFLGFGNKLLDASRILGKSDLSTFFKVALPIARPALIGGAFLVLMEVFNEYGAFKLLGINTFTIGLFRSWFGMNDLDASLKIASWMLFITTLLVFFEKSMRKGRISERQAQMGQVSLKKISGWKGSILFFWCLLPFLLGFGIPVLQLTYWLHLLSFLKEWDRLVTAVLNTLMMGGSTALLLGFLAFFLLYAQRIFKSKSIIWATRSATMGYAIPGAVIAISLLYIMKVFNDSMAFMNLEFRWILSTTLSGLLLAYLFRFLTVAYNGIEGAFERLTPHIEEVSLSLGKSVFHTLLNVDFRALLPAWIGCVLLCFVDLCKELPLTLILRPFDFDTLATRAFELADNEAYTRSALPALCIIIIGLLPVVGMDRLISGVVKKVDVR